MTATATPGVSSTQLGVPYDARFLPLQGEDASSLFSDATSPSVRPLNQMQHEYVLAENEESLAANATGWGFVKVNVGSDSGSRYGSYRAMQISHVAQVDDATEMRDPPAGAVYYLSRIYFGHSYEVILSGTMRDFHAGVRAQLTAVEGSIDGFAKAHRLTTKAVGRGLEPSDGTAIFAKTGEQIATKYRASGPAVPIIMEFRQIPNTRHLSRAIPWPEPVRVELGISQIEVDRDGTWGDTPWSIELGCEANGTRLPLDADVVWRGDTSDGGNYPVNRTWRLDLLPGDRLQCGLTGHYSGPIAGVNQLPAAQMQAPVEIKVSEPRSGVMHGADASVEYRARFSVTAAR